MTLIIEPIQGVPLIRSGDSLGDILSTCAGISGWNFEDGDILVLAQKIVSKAEDRLVNLCDVIPSQEAIEYARQTEKDPRFIELVLRESATVLRVRLGTIIVEHKLGFVCANAGIDHSNVNGSWGNAEDWVLLLPEDPDRSAKQIQAELQRITGKQIGVMIIDSHGRAWRVGTVGTAIGLAGVPGLVDMRGKPDMFGYQLRVTVIAAADELAGGASLVMGQADERIPAVIVRGFPYQLRDSGLKELIRPKELDLFR